MQNYLLTPHFSLLEFTESLTARKNGIDNRPPNEAVENLKRLCEYTLEPLREKLGLSIIITSGYRTKALNDIIVHASRKSQHISGKAADFYVGLGSRELLIQAFRLIITEPEIDFDQLILYPSFIHVSYVSKERNRHQITTANGQGMYCALSRAQALAIS
jgi:hypothetical protein